MKKCFIFGSAEMEDIPVISAEAGDVFLSADGGLRHMRRLGLTPDYLIGDFDSLEGELPEEIPVERYPSEKDDTDTALAVKKGLTLGCEAFYLYGCLGGSLSHTVANFQLLIALAKQGRQAVLVGDGTRVYGVSDGSMTFGADEAGKISVYSFSGRSEGVTLEGLKYPLKNAVLTNDFPLGASNEFLGKPSRIAVEKGDLLLILEKF